MVVPSSFSADRKGYNAYLKALGVDSSNQDQILANAIPFATFKAIDRESLQDKIDYAGAMCERMYEEFQSAKAAGLKATMEMAEGRWTYFSSEFVRLQKLRNAAL